MCPQDMLVNPWTDTTSVSSCYSVLKTTNHDACCVTAPSSGRQTDIRNRIALENEFTRFANTKTHKAFLEFVDEESRDNDLQ